MAKTTAEEKAKTAEAEARAAAYRAEHTESAEVAEFMSGIRAGFKRAEAQPREAGAKPEAQTASPPYTPAEDSAARASEERTENYGGDWYATRNGPGADEFDNQ